MRYCLRGSGAKALKTVASTPWENLSAANRNALMHGAKGFEGIIGILKELYDNYSAG